MEHTITHVHDVLRNYRSIVTKNRAPQKVFVERAQGADRVDISKEAMEKLKALKKTTEQAASSAKSYILTSD